MPYPADKIVPMPPGVAATQAPVALGGLPLRLVCLAVLLLRAFAIVLLLAPLVATAALLLG